MPLIFSTIAILDFKFGASGLTFVKPPGLSASGYSVSPSAQADPVDFKLPDSRSVLFKFRTIPNQVANPSSLSMIGSVNTPINVFESYVPSLIDLTTLIRLPCAGLLGSTITNVPLIKFSPDALSTFG